MSFGLIGDLIAGLPMLTYFEKKYPGSYKYWVIEKKCWFTAPLYFNHPLIDKIKITDNWNGAGELDQIEMEKCDIKMFYGDTVKHSSPQWWNNYSLVEETALMHGIPDMPEVLTPEEMKPRLFKWFDVGIDNPNAHTYSRKNDSYLNIFEKSIAIWPFAQGGSEGSGRNPHPDWWSRLIAGLIEEGYKVYHYGRAADPKLSTLSGYKKMTMLSFFDQVRAALASDLVIGVDTGPMWCIGAYSHPAIHLMTNWLPNHHSNLGCFIPCNDNGTTIFVENKGNQGCNLINIDQVIETVKSKREIYDNT